MSTEVEQVMEELQRMDAPARAEIAYRLLTSLGPEVAESAEVFDEELARRIEEIRLGRVMGRPLEEVLAELDTREHFQA